MNATPLYHDKKIVCDDEQITIRHYYFPFGWAKKIPYRKIKRIEFYAMGWWSGKGRIWGGCIRYHMNLDWRRPFKNQAIVLRLGRLTVPVITPDDVPAVVKILEQKTGLKAIEK